MNAKTLVSLLLPVLLVVPSLAETLPDDCLSPVAEPRPTAQNESPVEVVVLLHGLSRTPRSMNRMCRHLRKEGYEVINPGYPSRRKSIPELADGWLRPALAEIPVDRPVHIVAHSLGGILVRYLMQNNPPRPIDRVVMLAPPNQGSELADKLGDLCLYQAVLGPAGSDLGTDSNAMPQRLGGFDFECGVLAGKYSWNPFCSLLIPGRDDGKVSIARTQHPDMQDFKVMPTSHTWIMWRRSCIEETKHFLAHGRFRSSDAGNR